MAAIKFFGKSQQINLDDKIKKDETFKPQGRTSFRGLDITIENKKGSIRRGVDNDGEEWETKIFHDYGFIRGTMGVDGEELDVYLGPIKESDKVFIIHQEDPENGKFDEDKILLGFDSLDYARDAFLAHYDSHKYLGKITAMSFEEFKKKALATKNKPGIIKSFGVLIKALGAQLSMFDNPKDIVEGETRLKDGKVYEIKRSKKNPNVRRLFKREDPEAAAEVGKPAESAPKSKMKMFGQDINLFDKPGKETEVLPKGEALQKEKPTFAEAKKLISKEGGFANAKSLPATNAMDAGELAQSLGLNEKYLYDQATAKGIKLKDYLNELDSETDPDKRIAIGQKLMDSLSKEEKPKSEPIEDLFTSSEKPRPEKKDKDNLIENFGVSHLDSKIRKQRIEINRKVKELLASKKNDEFTPEDKRILAQYSGKGGTDEISLNEYYTPDWVAKFQWDMLEKLGFKGGPVLEPSCATGIFLHGAPENALITGVEYDETSSRIAAILFPEHDVYHMPFEKFNTENFDKEFKACIGNVPFGPRGATAALDAEKAKAYHLHEMYFLDRAIDDLAENGLASIIVPTGIMDNQIQDYRLMLNKKADFLGAIRMPSGVFKKANAEVTTDILFFRKRPEAVIESLNKLEGDDLSKLYDTMILDPEFINGTFFAKNPEYVHGEETTGQWGRKFWKGDLTSEELEETGDLIKNFEPDYSILGDIGLKVQEERELHVGDVITRNGRMYKLNENHRWERLEAGAEKEIYLPEELQKLLGIKTIYELRELRNDVSVQLELSRDQLKALDIGLEGELEYYTSSNIQKSEMLKRAALLGLAIKEFQTKMQRGIEKQYNNTNGTFFDYETVSTADAQREAQKLAMLLDDFKSRYGHPSSDVKLNAQMGKSPDNPMLYLVSAFDAQGNLSKLFTDPKAFSNIYNPKSSNVNTYNDTDLIEVISMLRDNGLSNSAESVKGSFSQGGNYTLNEFKKLLFSKEDVFIDENGGFNTINEVCSGEVYNKLDYWEHRIGQNKADLQNSKLTDEEKEVLVAENKKLDEQLYELKRRAEIRTLENLPVDISDCTAGFFSINYVNDYLKEKLGDSFKGEIIYNDKRKLFTFENRALNDVYTMHIAKGALDKEEKKNYEYGVHDHFRGEKNHISMVMLDILNGFSVGSAPVDVQKRAKEIETRFKTYLSETAANRDEIENKYNREYNNFIQKSYDGSVIEGLGKLDYDKIVATDKEGNSIKVRDQIKSYCYAGVRRMYEQGKGLVAHGVGLGKTIEALLLGALSKETGRCKKPTYIVPKSVAGNWNAEIKKWFKADTKTLIVGSHRKEDKNGAPVLDTKGREQWVDDDANEKKVKLSRIINEDFDFIVMTRDFYNDIRMSPKTVENMIEELVGKFYVATGDESDKKAEKKREAIKFKLANEFLGNIKRDKFGKIAKTDEIYFENLGLDMIIADECHSNKNLIESVLYSDIKYLNVKHSQRAMDFYFKSKIIRNENNDKGVYGMTATPISNSPMEVFNMLLPIAEKEFERMGIKNIDDFVKKFAEVDGVPTMDAAAKITNKNVFTKFKNLNLLRKTFFKYADYKTADMVGAIVHFPKENPNVIFCEASKDQKQIMKGLKLRLLQHEFKSQDLDTLVKDGFITEKEKEELKVYGEVHKQKVKQLSYLAKGDADPVDYYFNILDDMKKATADLEWYSNRKSPWADPIPEGMDYAATPKVQELLNRTITKYKDGEKQLIFATNITLHNKLKDQLITAGIKPDEILIVNGGTVKSSDARLKASEDFNSGRYKVVIGNYETMGEGLNFNIGGSAVHHLQPPWNGMAIDQGNGRVIRQGNILDSVNTFYYLTKGTIDAFFNQKILDKRGFVNAILTGKEDVMENDEGGVSADEMQIALAEDPEQARKLLQRKNEAFVRLMKERKVKENYSKLDDLFTQKTRLGRMKDKESLAYKSLTEEIDRTKNELNSSEDFEHKDILTADSRPIILPKHNAVIKVGSVVNYGSEQSIITGYSHSTGKITMKSFDRYDVKTREGDIRSFENNYNNFITPSKEDAETMFKKLIMDHKTSNIKVIEALPDEICQRYRKQIIRNLEDGYSHSVIARKSDGSYVGTDVDFATRHKYDIVLPQDSQDYFNIVDKAVKTSDSDFDLYQSEYAHKSTDKAEEAAERFFGENWENKIKYLKQKSKGDATTESEDLEFESAA
jgi:hypothetical protein